MSNTDQPAQVDVTDVECPPGLSAKDELEHAWRYFALHAGQRMSMFHYFMILFGLAAAGLAGCLRGDDTFPLLGVALGLVLAIISYVFYRLDQRTAFLIKHAERVLKTLESSIPGNRAIVFLAETDGTAFAKRASGMWTYGKCFRFVYGASAVVGIAGALISFALGYWSGCCAH